MYALLRKFLFLLPPERAHYVTMGLFKTWLSVPGVRAYYEKKALKNSQKHGLEIAGLKMANKLGIAAGFDKNAAFFNELYLLGFGFVEIGTVTPLAQEGNPKPRLFRLADDEGLINRMGFNNDGLEAAIHNLKNKRYPICIGGNIGKNKITPNDKAVDDYVKCFDALFDYVDYFVVNVSSPNTPGLRELQERDALENILHKLVERNHAQQNSKPIFLKIAPDLSWEQIDEIVEIVEKSQIEGLISNNTSISRKDLKTPANKIDAIGNGGLSGAPIKMHSRAVLQRILDRKTIDFILISSGGIDSPEEAHFRLKQGADLVQVWTGFIYRGPAFIRDFLKRNN